MSVTTANGLITSVEDVTVKPTRLQSQVAQDITTVQFDSTTVPTTVSSVPQILTLERAIKWFEENAQGEVESLFNFTALQLREQLSKNVKVQKKGYDEMRLIFGLLELGCIIVFIYRLIKNEPLKPVVGYFLLFTILDALTFYLFYYGTGVPY